MDQCSIYLRLRLIQGKCTFYFQSSVKNWRDPLNRTIHSTVSVKSLFKWDASFIDEKRDPLDSQNPYTSVNIFTIY
jgi:hypothetical protein